MPISDWLELALTIFLFSGLFFLVFRIVKPLGWDLMLIAAVVVVQSPAFISAPPTENDMVIFSGATNPDIKPALFSTAECFRYHENTAFYRPALFRWISANYHLWHRSYQGYHFSALLVFIGSAMLCARLAQLVFMRRPIALWSGVIFALHPASYYALVDPSPKGIASVLSLSALCLYADSIAQNRRNRSSIGLPLFLHLFAILTYECVLPYTLIFPLLSMVVGHRTKKEAFKEALPFFVFSSLYSLFPIIIASFFTKQFESRASFEFGIIGRFWDYFTSFIIPTVENFWAPMRFTLENASVQSAFPLYFSESLYHLQSVHWALRIISLALAVYIAVKSVGYPKRRVYLFGTLIFLCGISIFKARNSNLLHLAMIFFAPLVVDIAMEWVLLRRRFISGAIVTVLLLFSLASGLIIKDIAACARLEGIRILMQVTRDTDLIPEIETASSEDAEILKIEADKDFREKDHLRFYDDIPGQEIEP